MSFSISKNLYKNNDVNRINDMEKMSVKTEGEKLAKIIERGPISFHNDSGRLLYQPSRTMEFDPKLTDEYLRTTNCMFKKPIYHRENIVYDSNNGKWKLVSDINIDKYISMQYSI